MTSLKVKTLPETETPMTHAGLRIFDLRPHLAGDSKKRSDVQCSLCARSFPGASDQMDIPLCPACNRHIAAMSDDRIRSYIDHWLRKGLSPELLKSCRLTRAAS